MSENALVVPSAGGKYQNPDVIRKIAQSSKWSPRIQVCGSMTTQVKEGKIAMGRFGAVSGQNITDLGTKIVALLCSWRSKALTYSPEFKVFYNPESEEYLQICEAALAGGQNNPNQVGPEFLLWLPEWSMFAEFYHGNTTLRNESEVVLDIYDKQTQAGQWLPVEFKIDLAKKKKSNQSWHTSRCSLYDGQIPQDKFPDAESFATVLERFNNPKEDKSEKVDSTAGSNSDRD